MKIETPQILWHNGSEGNGKPAPLYSVSFLPTNTNPNPSAKNDANASVNAGSSAVMATDTNISSATATAAANTAVPAPSSVAIDNSDTEILATAGNSNEIHVWKLKLSACHQTISDTGSTDDNTINTKDPKEPPTKKAKIFSVASPGIHHVATLTRHERSINAVSFSPRGTHLASAGDGGTLIVHTVPNSHRYKYKTSASGVHVNMNTNMIHNPTLFWKTLFQSEKDLSIKIVHTGSEDVMDISWSRDERRFIIGTLDHSVLAFEEQIVRSGNNTSDEKSMWNCVWRNTKEHTHYVQGVSYDPLGVYLASQGSDRSVRVWQRKGPKNGTSASASSMTSSSGQLSSSSSPDGTGTKKNVLTAVDENKNAAPSIANAGTNSNANANTDTNAARNAELERHLHGKFEVGKAKMIKYKNAIPESDDKGTTINTTTTIDKSTSNVNANATASNGTSSASQGKKRHLFADESTVESFFRRLAWTTDGAFLVTPASLWHGASSNATANTNTNSSKENNDTSSSASSPPPPSYATYLFARHQFDKPYKVFYGLEKPSVVIRPNPKLFHLPKRAKVNAKENLGTSTSCLPYRSVFAVLTGDSILIYDTHHSRPLCIARGLHYAGLTDCSWTSDGRHLVVCSTDGYISIVSFEEGELGEVFYVAEAHTITNTSRCSLESDLVGNMKKSKAKLATNVNSVTLPPCEPGNSALVAPPTKKARTVEVSASASSSVNSISTGEVKGNVNVLSVRKKKRATLTSSTRTPMGMTSSGSNMNVDEEEKEKDVVGGVTNLSLSNQLQSSC